MQRGVEECENNGKPKILKRRQQKSCKPSAQNKIHRNARKDEKTNETSETNKLTKTKQD